jgi:uncharacterized protein
MANSNVVPTTGKRFAFLDSFRNMLAGMGILGRDKAVSQHWVLDVLNPQQLEYAYRGDWVARKIIQIPAFDCTRAWRSWEADKKDTEKLVETERNFNLQGKMLSGLEKARLYGGAAIVLGVDQGDFTQELDLTKVKKGDLKFVHVVERWMIAAGPRVRDITSPWFGEPTYYQRNNIPVVSSFIPSFFEIKESVGA